MTGDLILAATHPATLPAMPADWSGWLVIGIVGLLLGRKLLKLLGIIS